MHPTMRWSVPAVAGVLAALAGCASIRAVDTRGVPVLGVAALAKDPAPLEQAVKIPGKACVIKIAAGETLPVVMKLASPVASLEAGESRLRFDRDVYLYVAQGRMLISPDRERWTSVADLKAVKRLFGMPQGSFALGFGVSEKVGPFVNVALEAR